MRQPIQQGALTEAVRSRVLKTVTRKKQSRLLSWLKLQTLTVAVGTVFVAVLAVSGVWLYTHKSGFHSPSSTFTTTFGSGDAIPDTFHAVPEFYSTKDWTVSMYVNENNLTGTLKYKGSKLNRVTISCKPGQTWRFQGSSYLSKFPLPYTSTMKRIDITISWTSHGKNYKHDFAFKLKH